MISRGPHTPQCVWTETWAHQLCARSCSTQSSPGISSKRDTFCGFHSKYQVTELTAQAAPYTNCCHYTSLCLFKCCGSLQTMGVSQVLLAAESCGTDFGAPAHTAQSSAGRLNCISNVLECIPFQKVRHPPTDIHVHAAETVRTWKLTGLERIISKLSFYQYLWIHSAKAPPAGI